jgi:coenzyme Q-binding protein COQ10
VADVDSYNAFIPMCISSRVLEAKPYGLPGRPWLASDRHHTKPHELRAQLTIGFMGLQEAYTSQVTCQRPTEVKVRAATRRRSPAQRAQATAEASRTLKHLSSTWAFQPASAASPHPTADGLPQIGKTEAGPTLVSFDLAYQFADPMQQAAAGAFFDRISSKIMGAFEQRCITLYGASSA